MIKRDAVRMTQAAPFYADDVLLAVEIVSPSSGREDRVEKKSDYAKGGIPLYLLVDAFDDGGVATLFSQPEDGVYLMSSPVPFGGPIDLPKPFDTTIDTSRFE